MRTLPKTTKTELYVRTLPKNLRSLLSSIAARVPLRFAILTASHSAYSGFPSNKLSGFSEDSCRMVDPVSGCD